MCFRAGKGGNLPSLLVPVAQFNPATILAQAALFISRGSVNTETRQKGRPPAREASGQGEG